MDALVAVGFAANILQFVDGTCYILKIGRQLRRNGMTDSNLSLEQSIRFFEHQVARIRSQQPAAAAGSDPAEQVRFIQTSVHLYLPLANHLIVLPQNVYLSRISFWISLAISKRSENIHL